MADRYALTRLRRDMADAAEAATPSAAPHPPSRTAADPLAPTTVILMHPDDGGADHARQWPDRVEGVTAAELAAAVLQRRPPARAAPELLDAGATPATASVESTSPRGPPARQTSSFTATAAAVSPSSRFRVPPSPSKQQQQQAMAASHDDVHGHTPVGEDGDDRHRSAADEHSNASTDVTAEEEDEEEEDVAARVLFSLHAKDDVIQQLTRTVAALREENRTLRGPAAAVAVEVREEGAATTSSPSWPATPVRWWRTNHAGGQDGGPADRLGSRPEQQHAAEELEALQSALVAKEEELSALRASEAELRRRTEEPLLANALLASSTAAAQTAQARVAQLEWQLETLQQDKKEDTHTLRDHIAHLTRELHRRSHEMTRQQRQHKQELTALHGEVAALADQLEKDRSVAARTAAQTAPPREADGAMWRVAALQRTLEATAAREAELRADAAATQQRWQQELLEQEALLEEARTHAAREEAQREQRLQHAERQAQVAAQQQVQQLEAQLRQRDAALATAHRDLAALRAVHERTEATVAEQRTQLQHVTRDLAAAALEREHDEQRAARVEEQLSLLHQRWREATATVAAREAELQALQQARDDEAAVTLAQRDEDSRQLLRRVEGCMQGSEALEAALLQAESGRRELAAQLAQALAERDDYHRLHREASVQAQAQLVEQQQLLSEGHDVVCRRLHEVQQDLSLRTEALEATQRELRAAEQRAQALGSAVERADAAQEQLADDLREAAAQHAALTEKLVHTSAALKAALHAQLSVTGQLHRAERRLRSQQVAAQRVEEQRAEVLRAVESVAAVLWPPTGALPTRPSPAPALLSQRAAGGGVVASPAARVSGEACESRSTSAASSASSTADSANTSAAAPSLRSGAGACCAWRPPPTAAAPSDSASTPSHASRRPMSAMPLLRRIRDAVEVLCAAHAAAQDELGTRRTAVRTLLAGRKAQQAQLEELRTSLEEQRHKTARLHREAVQALRTESQAELEKVDRAWRERHEAGLARQLLSAQTQQQRAVAASIEACAAHVQAELIVFIQSIPAGLRDGLAAAVAAHAPPRTAAACDVPRGSADAAAAAPAQPVWGLDVHPDLQEECDAIVRGVLGLEGGWAGLASAVVLADSTTPAAVPAAASTGAPHDVLESGGAAAACWSAGEVAELGEVMRAYLIRAWSALPASPSPHSPSTPDAVEVDARAAPPHWMCSLPAPASVTAAAAAAVTAPPRRLLSRLLEACVAHVQARLLRT
ncbi:hypothetical protein NESM_000296800 [Novymonas esmeraldas]|uniref:Uncharacterized protein n=1 Tax=Novymonas esmeraldas TaxID=1808958 RepID=A0AAW0F7P2_9TRYP